MGKKSDLGSKKEKGQLKSLDGRGGEPILMKALEKITCD